MKMWGEAVDELVLDEVKEMRVIHPDCPVCGFDNPQNEMYHTCPVCGTNLVLVTIDATDFGTIAIG